MVNYLKYIWNIGVKKVIVVIIITLFATISYEIISRIGMNTSNAESSTLIPMVEVSEGPGFNVYSFRDGLNTCYVRGAYGISCIRYSELK